MRTLCAVYATRTMLCAAACAVLALARVAAAEPEPLREAKMTDRNGSPAITVNGEPIPPMLMTVVHDEIGERERAYYRKLAQAGFRVFFLMMQTDWLTPPDPKKPGSGGVARAKRLMKAVLEEVPDRRPPRRSTSWGADEKIALGLVYREGPDAAK